MPEIDFSPENKKQSAFDFDKFKLKKGERARIVLLAKPTFAWAHNLRAPQIVNGQAVKTTKQRTNRSGEVIGEYTDYVYDFISRPLCLGDYGILQDKSVDPDNCPACKMSKEGEEVNPPERRFAVNVIRYATQGNGQLVTPFSCTCLVWAFNEKTFGQLLGIAEEYSEAGGLLGRDLLIGPCINEGFQNMESMSAGAKNVWQASEDIKTRVMETFNANKVENLEAACGRKVERRWMENDLETVAYRFGIAKGTIRPNDGTDTVAGKSLNEGLTDLINTEAVSGGDPADLGALVNSPAAESTPAPAANTGVGLDDLINEPAPSGGVETAAKPAASQTAAAEPFDFDTVLGDLSKL
jgi:hypothetical protein